MGTIRVKNGLESDRATITPGIGEWLFATDSKRTYMGDGVTAGGVSVSKKHYEVDSAADIPTLEHVRDGDTCDTNDTNDVFMYVNGVWIGIYKSVETPLSWTEATLATGWTNYETGMSKVRYAKQHNMVLLDGGSKRDDKNDPDTVMILPEAFRPDYDITIPVYCNKGIARLDIMADGSVVLQKSGRIKWLSFNIRFPIGGIANV